MGNLQDTKPENKPVNVSYNNVPLLDGKKNIIIKNQESVVINNIPKDKLFVCRAE